MVYANFKSTLSVYGGNNTGCLTGVIDKYDNLDLVSNIVKSGPDSTSGKQILIKGDKCNPTYYLICGIESNVPNPVCSRWYNYKNRMIVKYSFSKKHIKKYNEIDQKLINKIDEFVE